MPSWENDTRNGNDEDRERDDAESSDRARSAPLDTIVWAALLIWAGSVLLAQNTGLLPALGRALGALFGVSPVQIPAWATVLLGAGIILLTEAVVRWSLPAYRQPVGGTLFWAIILIAVALGRFFGWAVAFPLGLIIAGGWLLISALLHRPSQ